MKLVAGVVQLSPTDLATYLGCEHATSLDVAAEWGDRDRPFVPDNAYLQLIAAKGDAHEREHLGRLTAEGREIETITFDGDFELAAARTSRAMEAGADVIYQAVFTRGRWRGFADFLERVDGFATDLGPFGYEAVDTKLARSELKAAHVLQLAFYSEGIAAIQGRDPEQMHLVLGSGVRETLRVRDFAAYRRRAAQRLEAAVDRRPPTEAIPVEDCDRCKFRSVCDAQWRAADSLHYVAGIRRPQIEHLEAGDVGTLTRLAELPVHAAVPHLSGESLEALREQARLQAQTLRDGAIAWERRPLRGDRGYARLPRPSSGDIVFDIEADPFWTAAQPLTFLFGLLVREGEGWRYEPVWAHDEAEERRAFELVVDRIHAQLAADPDMHVYHYSAADPTDLKRLMGRYATREEEIDELLRREVFVDLLSVVRGAVMIGLEGYGLKRVEALAGFTRTAGAQSGADAVLGYEAWLGDRDGARLDEVAAYNEEDVRATVAVRDWLLEQRPAEATWPTSVSATQRTPEAQEALDAREELRRRLVLGEAEDSPRWLAGQLLEYHRREARPAWWQHFTRLAMDESQLIADGEAIGGLASAGPPTAVRQSLEFPLAYPPQQHKLYAGANAVDPATRKGATIERMDERAWTLSIARAARRSDEPLPRALIPSEPLATKDQRAALARFAAAVDRGPDGYTALRDLLAHAPPRVGQLPGTPIQTTDIAAQRRLALALDESTLVIQGPPGTGKTWTGARLITELLRAGRRVGVTALSHKAIDNLLREVERAAAEEGVTFRGARRPGEAEPELGDARCIEVVRDHEAILDPGFELVAGTTWLFSRDAWDGQLDVLVVDEAGQLSLADAVAAGTCARSLILLGDPQQLAHVSQGTHPGRSGVSVLEHVLGSDTTVKPELGVLLETTWRMHPGVCGFVSDEFYDSRLDAHPKCIRQTTVDGTGIRFRAVEHEANASSSPEEAEVIRAEIERLLGTRWVDRDGARRPLLPSDLMVVAPYNAQVRELRRVLPEGIPVGTVDRFQGQEAAIVFFSMATSSGADLPRDLAFLFSRNRLNVAISRARCLAYVVCSPALLTARARSVSDMRLISTLCALAEEAERQAAPVASPA